MTGPEFGYGPQNFSCAEYQLMVRNSYINYSFCGIFWLELVKTGGSGACFASMFLK